MLSVTKIFFISLLFYTLCFSYDRRTDATSLTIATYNVEFLFDGKPPEYRASFPWKNNIKKAEKHIKSVAKIIRKINADILGLVEVENLQVLQHMNKNYLQGMNYKAYLIKGKDSYTGQDVGLLTRIDPVNIKRTNLRRPDIKGKSRGVSKNYFADFIISKEKYRIISAHFISRRKSNNIYRNAQAEILRKVAQQTDSNCNIIILGDFNAYDIQVPDKNNNTPECKAINILKNINPNKKGNELISVAEFVDKEQRYSCWYDKNFNATVDSTELSMLDYILITNKLSKRIQKVGIMNKNYNPQKISDHYPIWVRLKTAK